MWLTPCSSSSSSVRSASSWVTRLSAAAPKSVRVLSCPVRPNGCFSIISVSFPAMPWGVGRGAWAEERRAKSDWERRMADAPHAPRPSAHAPRPTLSLLFRLEVRPALPEVEAGRERLPARRVELHGRRAAHRPLGAGRLGRLGERRRAAERLGEDARELLRLPAALGLEHAGQLP